MKENNKGTKCWVKIEKCGVPIEKIAYYVQQLCKKDCDIYIKKFDEKYHECSNNDGVRYVANLLRPISSKKIDRYLQSITS